MRKRNSKIKQYYDYKSGGLKSVDISSKIAKLQCSWNRRSYDKNLHPWKVIRIKFHANLDLKYFFLKIFPKYYQEIVY